MNTAKTAKSAAKFTLDQFETIASQVKPQVTPFIDEAKDEVLGFFRSPKLGGVPKEIARAELARAREEQELENEKTQDENNSKEKVREIMAFYRETMAEIQKENGDLKKDHEELKVEVACLAKSAGVSTNIHLENTPKVGKIDISFLRFIIRTLKVKAEKSKSASDLVTQRTQIKATGMNAWVSGKQMKIHEQGTLTLQG